MMEVDFDKEIDALLRSNDGGRTITVSEFAALHIDADELAAFAENALPDAARKGYITHLADCDACRTTLSMLISINAEAESVSAVSAIPAVIAESSVPWYKRLFATRNLVYGMGALVIAFVGLLGYTVLLNSGMGDTTATVSQVTDDQKASNRTSTASNSENSEAINANSAKVVAANVNSAIAANKSMPQVELQKENASNTIVGEDLTLARKNSETTFNHKEIPPPPPSAVTAPALKTDSTDEGKTDSAKSDDQKVMRQEEQVSSAGNVVNTQSGPSRSVQRDNRVFDESGAKQKRSVPAFGRIASPSKTVSGKNFSKRDSIWYDSSYNGQTTTNVRRGTEDYRKLDSDLRTIAESLDGTVVVVWKAKAYRIQ